MYLDIWGHQFDVFRKVISGQMISDIIPIFIHVLFFQSFSILQTCECQGSLL